MIEEIIRILFNWCDHRNEEVAYVGWNVVIAEKKNNDGIPLPGYWTIYRCKACGKERAEKTNYA